jgi:hypothetical protein
MTRTEESRRHPRYAVDVEANLILTGGRRLGARTRDLSRSGICIITGEPLAGGALVDVDLVLAFGGDAFSEPLTLVARVVWCANLGGSFQVGAMFDDLTEQQDGFLEMFLQYLDGSTISREDDLDEEDGDKTSPGHDPEDKDDPFRP